MVEVTNELIYEILKTLQSQSVAIREDLKDIKFRLNALERNVAGIHEVLAHHSARFDRIDDRLDRIEKRLDLVEA